MSEPTQEDLQRAVAAVVNECMGVRDGEQVLVIANPATLGLGERLRGEAGRAGADAVLALMAERAAFMARQPGFVSIRLHRSLDGKRIVNYIQWKSVEQLHSAHASPEFRKEWTRFDDLTDQIDPHLYEMTHVHESRAQPRRASR